MKLQFLNRGSRRRQSALTLRPLILALLRSRHVAQTCSLLYRRIVFCNAEKISPRLGSTSDEQPTASRRYSRLKICVTHKPDWRPRNTARVAQTCSLPYRRIVFCLAHNTPADILHSHVQPT